LCTGILIGFLLSAAIDVLAKDTIKATPAKIFVKVLNIIPPIGS